MITSWAELAASILATPLVLFYLYILLISSLNRSVKVFLSMHGLNLFMLTTFQIVVAISRLLNPGEWRAREVISNLPLFLHQIAYSSCTVSMLLITIERTVMGLKPGLYGDSNAAIRKMIAFSLVSEVIISPILVFRTDSTFRFSLQFRALCFSKMLLGPVINGNKMYSTSETGQKISLLLFTIFDCSSLTTVIISFIRSTQRYKKAFLKSSLKIRYQVKDVIGLTRVLIPICCLSLVSRFVSITLAYLAYSDESKLDLYFTIIRFLCTGAAITEPLLMLTRQPLLQKRLRRLLADSLRIESKHTHIAPCSSTKTASLPLTKSLIMMARRNNSSGIKISWKSAGWSVECTLRRHSDLSGEQKAMCIYENQFHCSPGTSTSIPGWCTHKGDKKMNYGQAANYWARICTLPSPLTDAENRNVAVPSPPSGCALPTRNRGLAKRLCWTSCELATQTATFGQNNAVGCFGPLGRRHPTASRRVDLVSTTPFAKRIPLLNGNPYLFPPNDFFKANVLLHPYNVDRAGLLPRRNASRPRLPLRPAHFRPELRHKDPTGRQRDGSAVPYDLACCRGRLSTGLAELGEDGITAVANLPLFLHQMAYNCCNVSQLLITLERIVIGRYPRIYVNAHASPQLIVGVCVLSQLLIAIPSTFLVQDGPEINGRKLYAASEFTQKSAVVLSASISATSLLMVVISFSQSSERYNKAFLKATLGTRHQIREVILLTRVLIPVCCFSLLLKFAVTTLAFISYGNIRNLDPLFTAIRFCCTASAVIEPAVLLSRHRLLRNRLSKLFGVVENKVYPGVIRDPVTIADVYFDSFNKDLNIRTAH
ncbi:hypothetical protein PRIPAC_79878 [Pristionchus pacificus]|uniref:Uncharacterized protein n=1 Tax=Pristionchus pacificus TaxID=54126 RepID=A0A2A6CJL3_PRIPA|nr:hypothetical protein PRIPAC_79878 [Pristionchus pacificus]|eukprot:PDM78300.1 hypothetical protein PRIPAC_30879 [Pristionchus pacificus]